MRKSSLVPRLSLDRIESPPKRKKSVTFRFEEPMTKKFPPKIDLTRSPPTTDRTNCCF